MPRGTPLISLDRSPAAPSMSPSIDEPEIPPKSFIHYLPLCGTVLLILAPHPSLLIVLVNYHLQTLHEPLTFALHLLITYFFTFLAFSSLIVCVVRDPGPVVSSESRGGGDDNEEMGLTEALMPDIDFSAPGKWCRVCWAPKPERTHHCSHCGRCVLKMDHHCPWLGSRCIGHRTYPAFLHFLCSITLLATYIAVISMFALWFSFNNPLSVDEVTPVHELGLTFAGIVFSLVVGSFLCYHIYLVSTNQTTLENISQFILLRHLPPLPHSPDSYALSNPPVEHELSYQQRRLVRNAHGYIRLYDVGFRKNWEQVFGWNRKWGWIYRLLIGGGSKGDGKSFPRNPRADEMLARLAIELVKADKVP